jgi:hypothetical protein
MKKLLWPSALANIEQHTAAKMSFLIVECAVYLAQIGIHRFKTQFHIPGRLYRNANTHTDYLFFPEIKVFITIPPTGRVAN